MTNVFSIKSLHAAVESVFGTDPQAGYSIVDLAEDITWSPKVETYEFRSLKESFGEDDRYIKHSRSSSTLTFRVPMHGFLVDGGSYSTPQQHQLQELLYHCLGGSEIKSRAPDTPSSGGATSSVTPFFTTSDPLDDMSRVVAIKPNSDSLYQGRCVANVAQAGNYYGQLIGKLFNMSGGNVAPNSSSDMYHGASAYYTESHLFPTTYSFELIGGASDDAWILEGCAGTCIISGEVNGLVYCNFTFSVSDFTRTTRTALTSTGGQDKQPEPVLRTAGDPIPFLASQCSWHMSEFASFRPINPTADHSFEAVSFELDFGIAVNRMISLGSDQGTGYWYKSEFRPTLNISAYWDTDMEDMILNRDTENHVYINIGSTPGGMACIYVKNFAASMFPENEESGGLKLSRVSGKVGCAALGENTLAAVAESNQNNSPLRVTFL